MNKFKNTKIKNSSDEPLFVNQQNKIISTPVLFEHTIFIDEDITDPCFYREVLYTLRNAAPDDTILMIINTCGGDLLTAIPIINAMRQTQSMVVTELAGQASSAGSMIFLAGDECRVNSNTYMLVHPASYGSGGMSENVSQHVQFSDSYINDVFKSVYEGFLTEEEQNETIKSCRQWYMKADEILERLHKRNDYLLEKQAKEEDEAAEQELKDLEESLDSLGYALPTDSELEAMSKEQLISYIKGEEVVLTDEEDSEEVPLAFTMPFADDHYQAFVYEDAQVVIESSDDELSVNLICAERDLLVLLADDLDIEVKSKDPTERILKKIQKEIKVMLK